MKVILSAVAAAFALAALAPAPAWANPQHERMKRCNQDAKAQALKGDERKAFMSTCLKAGPAAAAAAPAAAPVAPAAPAAAKPAAAQAAADAGADKERSKACNQAAREQALTGAKRKAFVSECMKG